METSTLDRPEHLDDDSWRAVEEVRGRVHVAHQVGDLAEVVRKSKELVETVARVVILSAEGTVNEKLDFQFSRPCWRRTRRWSANPGSALRTTSLSVLSHKARGPLLPASLL